MRYRSDSTKKTKIRWKLPLLLLVVAAIVLLGLELTNTTNFIIKSNPKSTATESPSNQPTAKTTFDKGDKRTSVTNTNISRGGPTDSGVPPTAPPTNKQTTSKSGAITIYSPSSGDTIKNGSILSGKSLTGTVYMRLVDDVVGVIAEGPMSVKNGLFSANLQFSSKSNTGTLEVYSIDSSSGREINQVQLDVRF